MTELEHFLLYVAAPVVLFLALIEGLVLSIRGRFNWLAFGASAFDLVARILINIVVPFSLASPLIGWAIKHRLTTIAIDGWLSVLLLFIGMEFCYYWFHRASHRIRWFWLNHAIHHSSNDFNLSAAIRIGVWGKFIGTAVFFAPLVYLGFDVRTVFATLSLNLLYQFWIHAQWIPKLGFLEGILNTPSAHRVHHAANAEYLDANYGGVLIIFDRLFGTYVAEREDVPCRYGLVHPLESNNPLVIEFEQWRGLVRDLWHSGSWRNGLLYLVKPPGWNAHGAGSTTEELRAAATPISEKNIV